MEAPGGLPYFVFSYAGLLGWNLFSGTLTKTSASLVGNANLISKIFFPRLVLPLSQTGSVLVDFAVALGMMAGLMLAFSIAPGPALLLLPAWVALILCLAVGLGLIASSLAVQYRDVNYILPVFVQMLLYASPVAYGLAQVLDRLAGSDAAPWQRDALRGVLLRQPPHRPARGVPLVAARPGRRQPRPRRLRRGREPGPAARRRLRLQADGTAVRGCDLTRSAAPPRSPAPMSRSDLALSVRGLGKEYRIARSRAEAHSTLAESLLARARRPLRRAQHDTFWALKDVSFDVNKGDVVGVIGRNGAGKSTLLKVLSRITQPTTGEVKVWGRIGSLLEVGTGFHPELTGRENIFLNGAILGMTRPEIRREFDAIVDFAGVEKFLDTPVKRYSSGMYVRLAFAVAAHLNPEILIVDEVLAVGDAEFQRKCLGKMRDVAAGGRTVIFR